MEKEMATHSTIFAWRIPGTEEPDGLPSMGSNRVGHDWSDLAAANRSKAGELQGTLIIRMTETSQETTSNQPLSVLLGIVLE